MIQILIDNVALVGVYAIAILGLAFISGMAGLYSLCQGALFAAGAFTYAGLYAYEKPTDLLVSVPTAMVIGGVLGAGLALLALRVSGEAFIVTSFGLQIVAISVLYSWDKISGGPSGMYGLPLPTLGGVELQTPIQNMWTIVGFACLLFGVAWWIRRSPFGQLVRAMSSDESAVKAAGFRPFTLKLVAFVLGGAFAGAAGVLYSSYIGIAQTGDFDINISITLLAALLIGGARTLAGPLLGAVLFIALPRLLTLFDTPISLAGPLQMLIFGAMLVSVMLFLPRGLESLAVLRSSKSAASTLARPVKSRKEASV